MRRSLTSIVTAVLVASWVGAGPVLPAVKPAHASQPSSPLQACFPELPSGAVRLVNHARHGIKLAVCAEALGPPLEQSRRLIPADPGVGR